MLWILSVLITIANINNLLLLSMSSMIIGLLLALIVSQAAAIQPAKRAATSNILEAVYY